MENLSLFFTLYLTIPWLNIGIVEGIVGGQASMTQEFNYMVSIQIENEHICNGGIINELYILTAASCLIENDGKFKNNKFSVLVGINNVGNPIESNRFLVERLIVHKEYEPNRSNPKNIYYRETGDIALIKVKDSIELETVSTLNLPKKTSHMYPTYFNEKVIVTGFGTSSPKHATKNNHEDLEVSLSNNFQLRLANALVIHKTACKKYFPFPLEDKHLCAQLERAKETNSGVCDGDIGAPLVFGKQVIGILAQIRQNCDEGTGASLYTRVSSFITFINNVLTGKRTRDMRIAIAGNDMSQSSGIYIVEVTL